MSPKRIKDMTDEEFRKWVNEQIIENAKKYRETVHPTYFLAIKSYIIGPMNNFLWEAIRNTERRNKAREELLKGVEKVARRGVLIEENQPDGEPVKKRVYPLEVMDNPEDVEDGKRPRKPFSYIFGIASNKILDAWNEQLRKRWENLVRETGIDISFKEYKQRRKAENERRRQQGIIIYYQDSIDSSEYYKGGEDTESPSTAQTEIDGPEVEIEAEATDLVDQFEETSIGNTELVEDDDPRPKPPRVHRVSTSGDDTIDLGGSLYRSNPEKLLEIKEIREKRERKIAELNRCKNDLEIERKKYVYCREKELLKNMGKEDTNKIIHLVEDLKYSLTSAALEVFHADTPQEAYKKAHRRYYPQKRRMRVIIHKEQKFIDLTTEIVELEEQIRKEEQAAYSDYESDQ